MKRITALLKAVLRACHLNRIARKVYMRMAFAVIRARMRNRGLRVLAQAQHCLEDVGVLSFVDCGSLLGLMREGRLLRHDVDLDMGVVLDESCREARSRVRRALLLNGFRLKTEFALDDQVVEEGYYRDKIKLDVFYYRREGENSVSSAFYRDPEKTYIGDALDTVEFVHTRVVATDIITVQGERLHVPHDPENWLSEKYGKTWRIPDRKWIFWKGPNARYAPEKHCVIMDHGLECWPML